MAGAEIDKLSNSLRDARLQEVHTWTSPLRSTGPRPIGLHTPMDELSDAELLERFSA
ncbi:MAG: hypothetical protein ACRDT0_11995 [Pseudonocardiaceae bacterium]